MKLNIDGYTVNITAAWTELHANKKATAADAMALLCRISSMAYTAADAEDAAGYHAIASAYRRTAEDIHHALRDAGYFSKRGL